MPALAGCGPGNQHRGPKRPVDLALSMVADAQRLAVPEMAAILASIEALDDWESKRATFNFYAPAA
jgi:hypothetical protein